MKAGEDVAGDVGGDLGLVGVGSQIAGFNHVHPRFAIRDKSVFEGFAGRPFGADETGDALSFKIIFEDVPTQFMGVLKALNQALLFELGKGAFPGEPDGPGKAGKSLAVILKALDPADVVRGHAGGSLWYLPRAFKWDS